jgi:hypothetical protein
MNDFLDKTLSETEEQKVKSHLEDCEKCREEFRSLKNADSVLRQVVSGMVSGIDVPENLNYRIEKIISDENRKKTRLYRMFMLLKSPAVAAALIFVVLAAGFLGYNNYFDTIYNQPKVVLSLPDTGNHNNVTGNSAADKLDSIMGDNTAAVKEEYVLKNTVNSTSITEQTGNDRMEKPAGSVSDKLQIPPINQVPDGSNGSQTLEEHRTVYDTSTPLAAVLGIPAYDTGNMDEAIREVGFIPAKPAYLPQGTVLSDVSWQLGETSQNYRVGEFYFTVSQSRLEAAKFGYDELQSQGSAVEINGLKGYISKSKPEKGDKITGVYTTLSWQKGDWFYFVSGGLPADEIIRIAASIN